MRPPREVYIRTSRQPSWTSGEISVGIEYRTGDDVTGVQDRVYLLLAFEAPSDPDTFTTADRVARRLAAEWPDRAYFVEVWSGDDARGWVQIFQPFGLPRNGPTEAHPGCCNFGLGHCGNHCPDVVTTSLTTDEMIASLESRPDAVPDVTIPQSLVDALAGDQ